MVLFLNDILGTSPQTPEVFRILRDINSIELGQKKSIVNKTILSCLCHSVLESHLCVALSSIAGGTMILHKEKNCNSFGT